MWLTRWFSAKLLKVKSNILKKLERGVIEINAIDAVTLSSILFQVEKE